jgi:hypothetical protein
MTEQARREVDGWRELVAEGIEAVRLTREYVDGTAPDSTDGVLPALPGWSWFDWTEKARAALEGTKP